MYQILYVVMDICAIEGTLRETVIWLMYMIQLWIFRRVYPDCLQQSDMHECDTRERERERDINTNIYEGVNEVWWEIIKLKYY
jgi:hypothetical protein